jgi:hypothetical protein
VNYSGDLAHFIALQDIARLLGEAREIWQAFARQQSFACTIRPNTDGRLCKIDCLVEGRAVLVLGYGDVDHGFDTVVEASSPHPMKGRVRVRPTGDLDRLRRSLLGPPHVRIGKEHLDEVLSVQASSEAIGGAVLDERTVAVLETLVRRPLRLLDYVNGGIGLRWAGIERDTTVLLDAIELVAHLTVVGTETTAPYR